MPPRPAAEDVILVDGILADGDFSVPGSVAQERTVSYIIGALLAQPGAEAPVALTRTKYVGQSQSCMVSTTQGGDGEAPVALTGGLAPPITASGGANTAASAGFAATAAATSQPYHCRASPTQAIADLPRAAALTFCSLFWPCIHSVRSVSR